MNRREALAGMGATAIAAVLPAAAVATPIALDPFTYLTCKVSMGMTPEHRRELRILFRLPTEDAAYKDFAACFREMTADEWLTFRRAKP